MSSFPFLNGLTFDPTQSPIPISFGGLNYPLVTIISVDKMQFHTGTGDWLDLTIGTNAITEMQAPMLVRYTADISIQYVIHLLDHTMSTPLPGIIYGAKGELKVTFPAQPNKEKVAVEAANSVQVE